MAETVAAWMAEAMGRVGVPAVLGRRPTQVRSQVKVQAAVTADEVALLAQELGYAVSGSELLMLPDRSVAGVRVTRVDHPGEYPGRYY